MKRHLFISSMVIALVFVVGLVAHAQTKNVRIDKAIVQFDEPVKLLGVILKGEYLFLHDEAKMERGEPCTWIYQRGSTGDFDKLVTSFHCIPVAHDQAPKAFAVAVSVPNPAIGLAELLEYQFAGSKEGHRVPRGD